MEIPNHLEREVALLHASNTEILDLPCDANVASYQQWEANLPILDSRSTSKLVFEFSQGLLKTKMNQAARFEILTASTHCLLNLFGVCKKENEQVLLPLNANLSSTSRQLIETLLNYTHCYLEVACSDHTKSSAEEQQVNLNDQAIAALRAMELLSVTQLFYALLYQAPDKTFWKTVNLALEIAKSRNVQHLSLPTLSEDYFDKRTINGVFTQIQIFNLARPNRLTKIDINNLYFFTSLKTHLVETLTKPNDNVSFHVDLKSDAPASHISLKLDNLDNALYFDLSDLVDILKTEEFIVQHHHISSFIDSAKPKFSRKVALQLLIGWETQLKRKFERHSENDEITVYPGFNNIVSVLLKNARKTNGSAEKKEKPSIALADLELLPIDEGYHATHEIHSDRVINDILKATADETAAGNNIWGHTKNTFNAKEDAIVASSKDASLKGLHFVVGQNAKPLLKVTDLIGIQTQNEKLQLAIIRRINRHKSGDISVGVEFMSPNLKICNIVSKEDESRIKYGLFLSGIPAANQPDALLSPYVIKTSEENIILQSNGMKTFFATDKTLEQNQVFTHYTLTKMEELH